MSLQLCKASRKIFVHIQLLPDILCFAVFNICGQCKINLSLRVDYYDVLINTGAAVTGLVSIF